MIMKACNWSDKCCQNIVILETYYTVKVTRVAGKAHLHLTCSENSTNDYQNERSCTFNAQYPSMFVYECSTEDMLDDRYRHKSKQTETHRFNLHTKNTGFIVSQNLFSYFPKIQKICLLHADLKLDSDNIVWPKSLNIHKQTFLYIDHQKYKSSRFGSHLLNFLSMSNVNEPFLQLD
jgi:hypothetical protein